MKQPEYIIRYIIGNRHIYKLQENGQYKLWASINTKNIFALNKAAVLGYSYDSLQLSGSYAQHVDKVEEVETFEDLFVEII